MQTPRSQLLQVATPSCSPDVREAMGRLERLVAHRPELHAIAALNAELIATLFVTHPIATPSSTANDAVRAVISTGEPLFHFRTPRLDSEVLASCWTATCQIVAKHRDRSAPEMLLAAVRAGELSLAETLNTLFQTGPGEYSKQLCAMGCDVRLGGIVLRFAVLPVLATHTFSLQSFWTQSGWTHGYCPACGSWPLIAESRGLEQFRFLRCGLCGSGWQVDRVFCPYCETRDHRNLHDLFVEGEGEKLRLSVCERCRGFVRTISTLTPASVPSLLVMELETLHLELLAIERGYAVPDGGVPRIGT